MGPHRWYVSENNSLRFPKMSNSLFFGHRLENLPIEDQRRTKLHNKEWTLSVICPIRAQYQFIGPHSYFTFSSFFSKNGHLYLSVEWMDSYLKTLFQYILECNVLPCDFHWEQAWEQWACKMANCVVAHDEELLALLQRTAHPSTREEFESAIPMLGDFHVWKSNRALRHRFQDRWLAEEEISFYSNQSSSLSTIVS